MTLLVCMVGMLFVARFVELAMSRVHARRALRAQAPIAVVTVRRVGLPVPVGVPCNPVGGEERAEEG